MKNKIVIMLSLFMIVCCVGSFSLEAHNGNKPTRKAEAVYDSSGNEIGIDCTKSGSNCTVEVEEAKPSENPGGDN